MLAGMVIDTVPDPYSDCGGTIAVVRSTRDDPLAGMYSRQFIDAAQFSAGRKWQSYREEAGLGTIRGIDTTNEPVDGQGRPYSAFSDRQRTAWSELHVVARTLGFEGNRLIEDVLGDRMQLKDAAQIRNKPTKYIGMRFRESLETLAKMWSYA